MAKQDKKVGAYQAKDQADYDKRTKAYSDSSNTYNAAQLLNKQAEFLTRSVISNTLTADQADAKLKEKKSEFLKKHGKKTTGFEPTNMQTYTALRDDDTVIGKYTAPTYKAPVQKILLPKEIASAEQKKAAKAKSATGLNRNFIDTSLDSGYEMSGASLKKLPEPKYNIEKMNILPASVIPNNLIYTDPTINPYKPKGNYKSYTNSNNGAIGNITIPNTPGTKGYRKEIYNQNELADYDLMQFANGGLMNTLETDNQGLIDYYSNSMDKDTQLRKQIVGGVGSASKLLDLVIPGLGTGVSTGINLANNAFADGGKMMTSINAGGTHEESSLGGVPIGKNNLVEEDEVLIKSEGGQLNDSKDFVLSNRLSPMGSKKSYANIAKKLDKKYLSLRPDDSYSKNLVKKETDKLAEDQEAQKQITAIQNEAIGITNNIMALGGNIHINPANKGKFTTSAKSAGMGVQEFASHVLGNKEDYSPLQVKRANFAKNATKFQHADGGSFNKIENITLNKKRTKQNNEIIPIPEMDLGMIPKTTFDNNDGIKSISYFDPSLYKNFKPELINEDLNNIYKTNQNNSNELISKKPFNLKKAVPYSQLLGPATQMLTSLRKNQDLANLNYRTGEYNPIDEFYASNLARKADNTQAAIADANIRGNANTQGNYLAATLAAQSQQLDAPNQEAALALQANMQNNQGRNAYEANKAATINRNIDEREKLLDNSRTQFTNAIYNAGANVAGAYKTNKQYDQTDINNDIFMRNFKNINPNFDIDPITNEITYKKSNKYGGKLRKNC